MFILLRRNFKQKTTKEQNDKEKKLKSKKASSTVKNDASKKVAKKTKTDAVKKAKTTAKVSSTKKTAKKSSAAKKATSNKKLPSKKSITKSISKKSKPIDILEYYDLPYRYNQTIVRILAQTPQTLFVYWDISDDDRLNYIKQYGNDFFEKTKPVLIIHNKTMNYTFEIEINDFANCWYFNINDEKCEYTAELGRRPKDFESNINVPNNYLYITSSNNIESPNGHILFEKTQNIIFYRNIKTNETYSKSISNFEFIKFFGKVYNAFDMYKKMYKSEEFLRNK